MFNFLKNIFKPPVAIGPPEGGESSRGFERFNKNGERETVIIGEKEVLRGHSRGRLLGEGGKLDILKDFLKNGIKLIADSQKEMIPQGNLKMPVRAVAEVFDELIETEISEEMKEKWTWMKKAIIYLAEEDDAYCFRMQWFLERLFKRKNQIKLSKADKYYFHSRNDFNWELFEYGKRYRNKKI